MYFGITCVYINYAAAAVIPDPLVEVLTWHSVGLLILTGALGWIA